MDLLTIGRCSVDLYGEQSGGRLEDMTSFRKYVGGSPANIAIGAARLGLSSGLISRVGDEHMGRFIREELRRAGVSVAHLRTDPARLTALVLLGIRDDKQFPLIFYRENCADMALCVDDIDITALTAARCVVATGTHLSHLDTKEAVIYAIDQARKHKLLTALDIDYRPNLWGLAGHDAGQARYIESSAVSLQLQQVLSKFDLIVGTEEEMQIAGGRRDLLAALRNIRKISDAVLVCKSGPKGAMLFTDSIPDHWQECEIVPGFRVESYNVLGAGDGFMAGLLYGWLGGKDWKSSLVYANACGAFAVSRHGCAPAYPSEQELQYFLANHQIVNKSLRKDHALEHIHWATVTRRNRWPKLRILDFSDIAPTQTKAEKTGQFQDVCLSAMAKICQLKQGEGIICDSDHGRRALYGAADYPLWIGRPALCGTSHFDEWPVIHHVCLTVPGSFDLVKTDLLWQSAVAARQAGLEILVKIDPENTEPEKIIARIYASGIRPDWWCIGNNLAICCDQIHHHDRLCRGVIVARESQNIWPVGADHPLVKGQILGKIVWGDLFSQFLAGVLETKNIAPRIMDHFRHEIQL